MENEEKAAQLIELVKKAYAGLPQPHDVRTREHYEQCDECREWRRAVENSFEKIEGGRRDDVGRAGDAYVYGPDGTSKRSRDSHGSPTVFTFLVTRCLGKAIGRFT